VEVRTTIDIISSVRLTIIAFKILDKRKGTLKEQGTHRKVVTGDWKG
jgi:hypothetical protein